MRWVSTRAAGAALALAPIGLVLVVGLATLGLASCRESPSVSPDAATKELEPWPRGPTEGFVIVPQGTQVYLEPRVGSASARLGWPGTSPPWPSSGFVARAVGWRDGFVEIAPVLEDRDQHCGLVLDGEAFDVRLYVSPWALASLVTREVETLHEDGSTLSLHPGALAQRIPNDPLGRSAVMAGGIRLRTVLPDDALGLAYAAGLPIRADVRGSWLVPEGRPFSFEGLPLELDPALGYQVTVASVEPEPEGFRVELVTPCARVLAHSTQAPPSWEEPSHFEFGLGGSEPVPEQIIEEALVEELLVGEASGRTLDFDATGELHADFGSSPFAGFGRPFGASTTQYGFEAGTPVYLSSAGPAAGKLSYLRVFSEEAWVAGDRTCFRTSFGARFDPALAVCLPTAEARLRNPAADMHDLDAGTVHPGTIQTSGALAEPAVAAALRRHRFELRRCWALAIQQGMTPASEHELELELDVNGSGAVTHVRLHSTWVATFTDCVVQSAPQWTMPATDDGKPAKVVFSVRIAPR